MSGPTLISREKKATPTEVSDKKSKECLPKAGSKTVVEAMTRKAAKGTGTIMPRGTRSHRRTATGILLQWRRKHGLRQTAPSANSEGGQSEHPGFLQKAEQREGSRRRGAM